MLTCSMKHSLIKKAYSRLASKNILRLIKPENSLMLSQYSVAGSYPEQMNPVHTSPTLYLQGPF
jgi:hypothetical protein